MGKTYTYVESRLVRYAGQGKPILDATVVEQAMHHPTDFSLVKEALKFCDQVVDILYLWTDLEIKLRTYRVKARKAYPCVFLVMNSLILLTIYFTVYKQRTNRPPESIEGSGL